MYVCAVDICKYVSECVHVHVGMYVHAWMYVCLFTRVSVRICFGYQANVGCLEWWNFWWKLWRICPGFVLSLWGVFSFFFFFLNDCFSLAVFMGLLKLLVCPWFNFGRSHISRGLFISSRLPDSFEMCVFKAFPNNFLDFIGVQWDVPFFISKFVIWTPLHLWLFWSWFYRSCLLSQRTSYLFHWFFALFFVPPLSGIVPCS